MVVLWHRHTSRGAGGLVIVLYFPFRQTSPGESIKQGYFGYVLPCRCQDGTHAILKLSPLAQEAQEQVIAWSAWAGCDAAPLLAESFEDEITGSYEPCLGAAQCSKVRLWRTTCK